LVEETSDVYRLTWQLNNTASVSERIIQTTV